MEHLSPIIKWTGGKRREIKNFETFFPEIVRDGKYVYVEPFIGGAAVYFYLNNINGKNVINDFDFGLINFYKHYDNKELVFELERISKITDHDELENEYYKYRDLDKNGGLNKISDLQKAVRFYIVNQLAFSGMRRFNASGEFNVPFGHYKHLSIKNINSQEHVNLIKNTEILNLDFEKVMCDNDKNDVFIFLDPPYTRVFKTYSSENTFGEKDHNRLAEMIRSIKHAKVMMIIDESEYTLNKYRGLVRSKYLLKYGVNIKNRFDSRVTHLIVTNYEVTGEINYERRDAEGNFKNRLVS